MNLLENPVQKQERRTKYPNRKIRTQRESYLKAKRRRNFKRRRQRQINSRNNSAANHSLRHSNETSEVASGAGMGGN